ncbi:MAG: DJ-1/PfpI family protein [Oscillospiraceae bacterium]|nr:DJ-1/PfpI family protein [Oscillospiraceae bacterium]
MKALLFLANGFEEIEALSVVDILRRAGVTISTCSIMGQNQVKGSHNIIVIADLNIKDIHEKDYDVFILPGGMPGAKNLKENKDVIRIIKNAFKEKKLIAAICAAPIVLIEAGILKGKNVTSYPGFLDKNGDYNFLEDTIVIDENIITSRGPATAPYFAFAILEKLGIDPSSLKESMLYNLLGV